MSDHACPACGVPAGGEGTTICTCGLTTRDVAQKIASLVARLAAAERERDEARAEYRKNYDCEDDATPADLIRLALDAEAAEHARFKARGAELDRLTRSLDAAERRAEEAERARDAEREKGEAWADDAIVQRHRLSMEITRSEAAEANLRDLAMELTLTCNSFENAYAKVPILTPDRVAVLKAELDASRALAEPHLPPEPWHDLAPCHRRRALRSPGDHTEDGT